VAVAVERPSFTVGIEEEYLIVDRETRDLVRDMPDAVMIECEERLAGQVSPEFLRSQIEVGTKVSNTLQEAKEDLAMLRRTVAEVTGKYGLAPIAASTHPFAEWGQQIPTDKERYRILARDMAGIVRRLVISGMHVHVCIDDEDLRIDLMNQVVYFLPHLLALSTSSPFWTAEDTGLKSYRTSVFRTLPRTGLPDEFNSWADYRRHVNVLIEAGVIEDATKLWWDIRPSDRYPTLEMRSSDVCTSLDDGIAIASIYMSLLAMLYRHRMRNRRWRIYSRSLIDENIWRAQRYGATGELIDFGQSRLVPFEELVEEIIDIVRKDAEELGCFKEVQHARTIVERGTSAQRQVAIYNEAIESGASAAEAGIAVVDFLIEETVAGL
jgi:carboxylate-amine ligase